MIQQVYEWCVGKATKPLPATQRRYDEGYVAGYRDCARFLMDWMEEGEDIEAVDHD